MELDIATFEDTLNYALVDNAADLARWPGATGRDSYGTYHIITEYEGTGRCFWCGENLLGQRRRFSGHRKGCWTEYANHFYWSYARNWCCERQKGVCANCGWHSPFYHGQDVHFYIYALEVHHIIPLNGEQRATSPYNLPWNLIGFCHDCHQLVHAAMRPEPAPPPDPFELALSRGQMILEGMREIAKEARNVQNV